MNTGIPAPCVDSIASSIPTRVEPPPDLRDGLALGGYNPPTQAHTAQPWARSLSRTSPKVYDLSLPGQMNSLLALPQHRQSDFPIL